MSFRRSVILGRGYLMASSVACTLLACKAHEQSPSRSEALTVFGAYVHAWNHHDAAALDTLLAGDGLHEDLAQRFTGRGPREVRAFMEELVKAEPDFDWHVVSAVAIGDTVAAEWTWTSSYTGPTPNGPVTNLHISGRGASIAIVQDHRIKRFTDYYDNASSFPLVAAGSTKH